MSPRVAVVGGTGATGRAVVAAALADGHDVLALARSATTADLPAGASTRNVDARSAGDLTSALRGVDVVINAAQAPYRRWSAELPALFSGIADATARVGARLVLADNLYAYGPTRGPMSATTPEAPNSSRGILRARLAGELLARHARGELPVTIARASDLFGPYGRATAFGDTFVASALDKGRVDLIGGADAPHAVAYLPDVGRSLLALALDATSAGRVWMLPSEPAVTPRAFAGLVGQATGRVVRVRVTSSLAARLLGVFVPIVRDLAPLAYQFREPFTVDDAEFRAAYPAFTTTPLPAAVRETVRWFQSTGSQRSSVSSD